MTGNHENDEWVSGEKTEAVVAFLDRLYTAKKRAEDRIVILGGEAESVREFSRYFSMIQSPNAM